MVRVISVHNFLKQEITSIDDSTDIAAVPPDILLLAQPNNTIIVKNLSAVNHVGYVIPTVDQVLKINYSIQGNYIATLESKITRSGTKVSYTRVYINWDSLKEHVDSFPLRARIAGRVTPLSQSQVGLEMVEIPNQYMPENISCCPISGNLLVSSRNILNIYLFVIQTHDISKIHFIDFNQLSVDLHISFTPNTIKILEDMIAVQNNEYLHVFKVKSAIPLCSLSDKEFNIDDFEKIPPKPKNTTKEYKTIYYDKLIKEINELRFPLSAYSTEEIQKKIRESDTETELSKLGPSSFPLVHEFPAVLLEKSLLSVKGQEMFRQNPFVPVRDLSVNFVTISTSAVDSKSQYKAVNLCQYHLVPLTVGNIRSDIEEKFTFLILKPFYTNEKNNKILKHHLLESDHYSCLKSIACFFGTQQEGYLQCFEYAHEENDGNIMCDNYVTYTFTAPAFDVQLDDCFLHAITETGLETYTLRAAKHLLTTNETSACPSSSDPVCLIGLHPFVNVFQTCITDNYLTLFANNEESSCTLYQLKSPDTPSIWKDFLSSADDNKWEAPSTYCEMLGEGHLILKTKLKTLRWISKQDPSRNFIAFASYQTRTEEIGAITSLYKESCALLGDYHILNKNNQVSYCYYTMSGFKIGELIKRIRGLRDNIPESYREKYKVEDITCGLIYILKKTLSFYDQKFYEFAGNREEFYSQEIGNLVTSLMDLLESEEQARISDLVLDSVVLREFSTDRILKMLRSLLSKSSTARDKDALSLALMCIQRDQSDQAKTVLRTMTAGQLESLLLQYYDLLFANHCSGGINMFTELSMIIIEIYPNVLATVLSELLTNKRLLSLSKVLNIFMDILPAGGIHSKNSSFVLQIILENYFKFFAEHLTTKKFDYKTTEAMKILIRIYLTRLKQSESEEIEGEEETVTEILFHKSRPMYLNKIPPFGPELKQLFLCPEEKSEENLYCGEKKILLKLQCILSFSNLPDECLVEVRNFLKSHSNLYGSLSLRVLSAENVREAIELLLAFAPQPLVQYSKERLKEKDDWKFLIAEILKRINELKEDERLKFLLDQLLSEVLHHVAETLNIEDLLDVIPKDYQNAEKYFILAQNNAQANHLKTLIMITGKQLLASI